MIDSAAPAEQKTEALNARIIHYPTGSSAAWLCQTGSLLTCLNFSA